MKRICLALVTAVILTGCVKGNLESTAPKSTAVPVTVNIDQDHPGYVIPSVFEGLSYETGIFGESPDFVNENNAVLIQLIKNLGKGFLRIGGNTSDEILWTNAERTDLTPAKTITQTDIDHLAAFSKQTGWPVIFGLNLGHFDALAAATEAQYVHEKLQTNLYALQFGNEPDAFKNRVRPATYTVGSYLAEWNQYYSAVKKVVSGTRYGGPDVVPFNPAWVGAFATAEHANAHIIDSHYYNTGPASNPAITYQNILTTNTHLDNFLVQMETISAKYRMPFRVSECNSVFGGGKPGVSDVFASALWALDFMWDVAQNKGQGINFHGGQPRFAYTPITMENGVVSARPEYYGMLAFKYGGTGGTIIPATIFDPRDFNNCSAYACVHPGNVYTVTLINKEVNKDFAFNIQLTKTAGTIQVARLLAPSITAKTGITYAGSSVNADGTFAPATATVQTINAKTFVVTVPAGSAAVITVK